jgi:hypothetical protein
MPVGVILTSLALELGSEGCSRYLGERWPVLHFCKM